MSEQKTAIVTGAGSGVGRATAIQLAERGYRVALVARTEEKLKETQSRIGDAAIVLPADLTDAQACHKVVSDTVEQLGQLDVLVNVAGSAPLQPIERITPDIWQQCVDINLSAVVHLTAAAFPVFRKQKSGFIANVSSMASIDPFPGFNIYAAAKVGVNLFTKATADEGQKRGINAVAIAPGAIETQMLRDNFKEKLIPKDKTLSPEQVATVLVECICGEREFEPGETLALPSPS